MLSGEKKYANVCECIMPKIPVKNRFKKLDAFWDWVWNNFALIVALYLAGYFIYTVQTNAGYAVETHARYIKKGDAWLLGVIAFWWGVVMAVIGYRKSEKDKAKTLNAYAENRNEAAKNAYERNDYVAAAVESAKAVGATDGIHGEYDCSDEYHLLATSLDALKHPDATEYFDFAAGCARESNTQKVGYYFDSAISHLKKNNWDFVLSRAGSGLYYIDRNPNLRFQANRLPSDLGAELRMLRLLASVAGGKGTKAFDACRDDAAWIIANSKDQEKISYAKKYLAANGEINRFADKVMSDYLREGRDNN
jgi:hypothetical protein